MVGVLVGLGSGWNWAIGAGTHFNGQSTVQVNMLLRPENAFGVNRAV